MFWEVFSYIVFEEGVGLFFCGCFVRRGGFVVGGVRFGWGYRGVSLGLRVLFMSRVS